MIELPAAGGPSIRRRGQGSATLPWIWTDAEVASLLSSGFVGVKLDGDIEKGVVQRFSVAGYPTMIVLDPSGTEAQRAVGYLSSKETIAFLTR